MEKGVYIIGTNTDIGQKINKIRMTIDTIQNILWKLKSDYTKTTSKLLNYFLMILGISFIILGIFKFIK